MEIAISLLSTFGASGILLFFIKRYFDRRDAHEAERNKEQEELIKEVKTSLETIRLLAYARMSEEIERCWQSNDVIRAHHTRQARR